MTFSVGSVMVFSTFSPFRNLIAWRRPSAPGRRVEEGGGQLAIVHPGHALGRQRVDADELDVLLAADILGGEIGAIGHRIVVAVDEVDLLVVAQRGRHDVVGLVLLPVAGLLVEQVLDARLLVGELVEAVVPVVRRLGAHAAPDLDHVARRLAGAAQHLDGIFAGGAADQLVVAADELRVLVGLDVAVEHEDRDLGIDRLLHHAGQAGRFLRRDQQRVDFLADQVLDVGDLLLGLVLAVGDDELDLGMLRGFGDDVLVELDAPRLDRGRLREADLPFLVLRERVTAG